jgi:hydroxypyruvate isomerase
MTPFALAVCAELVWTDRPLADRAARLRDLGFDVEIWGWWRHDLAALARVGARVVSMTGYRSGNLTDPDGAAELLRTAAEAIAVARDLGVPRLNLHGTGLDGRGLPVVPLPHPSGADWLAARDTLNRLADMAEASGVTFMLENLNTQVDHPGVPFARAADALTLVAAVNRPGLGLNLDLYHAQIGEGNLIELCRRALPWIAEIQVADVPGRTEPGTGEVNWPAIARALVAMGYAGPVGFEGHPAGDSRAAVEAFRRAFTPGDPA